MRGGRRIPAGGPRMDKLGVYYQILPQRLGYRIVETQDVDDKVGNGFTVVIRK